MPNAFQRRFPLLALQFIHFRELRTSWLILLLLVFLVTIATTYPEVSRDSAFWIRLRGQHQLPDALLARHRLGESLGRDSQQELGLIATKPQRLGPTA